MASKKETQAKSILKGGLERTAASALDRGIIYSGHWTLLDIWRVHDPDAIEGFVYGKYCSDKKYEESPMKNLSALLTAGIGISLKRAQAERICIKHEVIVNGKDPADYTINKGKR